MSWNIDRRDFLTVIGAAATAGITLPRSLRALVRHRSGLFSWTTINGQLHVAIGSGGNSLLVKGTEASALVDSKILGAGPSLLDQSRSVAEGPVHFLFNTHHHGDHSGGNNAFGDSECIAHENAAEKIVATNREAIEGLTNPEEWLDALVGLWGVELSENERAQLLDFAAAVGELDPQSFAPDRTFARRLQHLDTGVELNWRHVGPAHTDNDGFLFVPQHNVLHAGDILFVGSHPFMNVDDGGTTVGWQRSLAAAFAMCNDDTVVIPGHGPITNKMALRAQSQYFDRLRERVITAIGEGRPRELIVEFNPSEFSELIWRPLLRRILGILYDELQ